MSAFLKQWKFIIFLVALPIVGRAQTVNQINYYKDIKPILQKNCAFCHQKEHVGPMPLTNYEEVYAYGEMIGYVTSTGLMPPWKADTNYRHYANKMVLTQDEINVISKWVKQGFQEGEELVEADIMSQKGDEIIHISDWGILDFSLSMMDSFEHYGIYFDQFQVFPIPLNNDSIIYIDSLLFVPGNKDIVRMAQLSITYDTTFKALDRWDPRYGYFNFGGVGGSADLESFYTWTPNAFDKQPKAKNVSLKPKATLLIYMHYGPTGRSQKDLSKVHFWTSSNKAVNKAELLNRDFINVASITNPPFVIPPGTTKKFHASYVLEQDITLLQVLPKANLICKDWEVYVKRNPSENNEKFEIIKLLKIPRWDFHWRTPFVFEKEIKLKKGDEIHAIATFDNSIENDVYPSFKIFEVKQGDSMFEEPFEVWFQYFVGH